MKHFNWKFMNLLNSLKLNEQSITAYNDLELNEDRLSGLGSTPDQKVVAMPLKRFDNRAKTPEEEQLRTASCSILSGLRNWTNNQWFMIVLPIISLMHELTVKIVSLSAFEAFPIQHGRSCNTLYAHSASHCNSTIFLITNFKSV